LIRLYKGFFSRSVNKSTSVVVLLVIAGYLELVSFGAMLPLFGAVVQGSPTQNTELARYTLQFLNLIGIGASVYSLSVFVICALLLRALALSLSNIVAEFAANNISIEIRRDLLQGILNANWRALVSRRSGVIANTIANEANNAGGAYLAAANFIANSIQATIYMVVAVLISRELALAGLILGIILFGAFYWIVRLSRVAGEERTTASAELLTSTTDALGNLKVIKAMGRNTAFMPTFEKHISSLNKALKKQIALQQLREFANNAYIAIIFGVGFAVSILFLEMPFTELVVAAVVVGRLVSTWRKVQDQLQGFAQLEAAFFSAEKMVLDFDAQKEPDKGTKTPTLNEGCRFHDVTFAYQDLPVVSDASFEIPAKAVTVFQGPSGSGKTTIVDMLLGLHRPNTGEIFIDGTSLDEISLASWRSMVGYVPQEVTLLHRSVRDNITLGDDQYTDDDVRRALELAGALQFVEAMPEGLDEYVGEMGTRLSGGQRQRVSIARAIIGNPGLLVLDEVTSALDPTSEREICENILSLKGDFTFVVITHRPIWAKYADRLFKVENGRVQELQTDSPGTSETPAPESNSS